MCKGCKHLWEDASVNAYECLLTNILSDAEFEKYFINDEDGCPFYESDFNPQEEDYFNKLLKGERL